MSQPTTCNPASALPMRCLSRRAQAQLQPKSYGQRPPPIGPRTNGAMPKALRTSKAVDA